MHMAENSDARIIIFIGCDILTGQQRQSIAGATRAPDLNIKTPSSGSQL